MATLNERKLLSFLVPVLNEEENIERFYEAMQPVLAQLADRYDYELLFTDNHSTDQTLARLAALGKRDPRVRVIRFSRNFGYQRSIWTGYLNANGDAAIQLDCDLQDPPEVILDFVRHWEEGYQVVYGVRIVRHEGWWMGAVRKAFYWLIDLLAEDTLPQDAGDFRLVDRRLIDEIARIEDSHLYLRGSIAAMGFRQLGLPYERAARERGRSKFGPHELFALAIDGVLNHSIVPLRFATFLGLAISAAACVGLVVYFIGRATHDWPAGFATLVILLLLSMGMNALFLGIIGEYLARIFHEVKRQPLVIVEETINTENVRCRPAPPDTRAGAQPKGEEP